MSIASSKPADPPNSRQEMPETPDPQLSSPTQAKETLDRSSVRILAGRQGRVDLETDQDTLAHYLHDHSEWIERCFKPLKVLPLSPETYKLQFFRIGGLGFELEPCFGVRIWPEQNNVFWLSSIDLPEEEGLPYTVDCLSYFRLEELDPAQHQDRKYRPAEALTRVHWDLKLDIWMQLPGFLQALPYAFVYRVGTWVVHQVTRSMSDRLTHNVCTDFYRSVGKKGRRYRIIDTTPKGNVSTLEDLDKAEATILHPSGALPADPGPIDPTPPQG